MVSSSFILRVSGISEAISGCCDLRHSINPLATWLQKGLSGGRTVGGPGDVRSRPSSHPSVGGPMKELVRICLQVDARVFSQLERRGAHASSQEGINNLVG